MLTSYFNLRRPHINLNGVSWKPSINLTTIEDNTLETIVQSYHKAIQDEKRSKIIRGGLLNRFIMSSSC